MAEEKCRKVVYLVPMTSMADMVGKLRDYEESMKLHR